MDRKRIWSAALLAAVMVLSGMTIALVTQDDGNGHKSTTITVTAANNKKVPVTPRALAQAAGPDAERGLSGDGNASQQRSSDKANPDGPKVTGPIPLASPYQRGCLTRSNSVNFSYRNGTRPSIIVIHLTVSPNVVGWSDVNGVWGFLNRGSTQASANYIIDAEGHCIYAVPESDKAWAQVSYNSASACAIEVINTGNEPTYAGTAGLDKLATVVHDCAARWHIPLQRAVVSGGRVIKPGLSDHFHLGLAGGGHVDIHNFGAGCRNAGPGADTWACVDLVLAKARGGPITAGQRARCTELNTLRRRSLAYHRHYRRPGGHALTKRERARAAKIRAGFHKHGVLCRVGAPGKRGSIVRR